MTRLDATTRVILETIGGLDYVVHIEHRRGVYVVSAVGDDERFIVRGPDSYQAACELAQAVGIDLEDG